VRCASTFIRFSGWKTPKTLRLSGDRARLEAHYAELSRRVGYPVLPPEQLLNEAVRCLELDEVDLRELPVR
jgi:hypothetical protein